MCTIFFLILIEFNRCENQLEIQQYCWVIDKQNTTVLIWRKTRNITHNRPGGNYRIAHYKNHIALKTENAIIARHRLKAVQQNDGDGDGAGKSVTLLEGFEKLFVTSIVSKLNPSCKQSGYRSRTRQWARPNAGSEMIWAQE